MLLHEAQATMPTPSLACWLVVRGGSWLLEFERGNLAQAYGVQPEVPFAQASA